MIVLGIETSCDETAVALVNDRCQILSHQLVSQIATHTPFGGVVPEVAAREHLSILPRLIQNSLIKAQLTLDDVDAIAATAGPGLIGGVMVGVMMAKSMAMAKDKPFIAVNHLAAHVLTVRLIEPVAFPYLTLLVSGGHCQLVYVKSAEDFMVLGTTIDDAAGECFDKTARALGLSYPGGAEIEMLARSGCPTAFKLPISFMGNQAEKHSCTFSFSGLKSAVRRVIEQQHPLTHHTKCDIAASLQHAMVVSLVDRTKNAVTYCRENNLDINGFVVCGGVAANQYICGHLQEMMTAQSINFYAPPQNLCTDNGVMIAWAGLELFKNGRQHPLSFKPRPRWSLEELCNA